MAVTIAAVTGDVIVVAGPELTAAWAQQLYEQIIDAGFHDRYLWLVLPVETNVVSEPNVPPDVAAAIETLNAWLGAGAPRADEGVPAASPWGQALARAYGGS